MLTKNIHYNILLTIYGFISSTQFKNKIEYRTDETYVVF